LSYLHNVGVVFHRPGLFHDSIVLDQSWALDAIYAVFHREKSLRWLQRSRGRFTRSDRLDLIWQDYSRAEADLFISMMESCGIRFTYKDARQDSEEAEYIAPDLLPERAEIETELAEKWDPAQPTESVTFDYALLHPGLMRGVIVRIGSQAGVNALYWRGGVCVYEKTTRSHALIEQEAAEDDWRGRGRVQTQGGQAQALLDELIAWVEREGDRIGLRPSETRRLRTKVPTRSPETPENAQMDKPTLAFTQPAAPGVECFVSYAWGDATPEGLAREAVVDQLCEAAATTGLRITRDKTALRTGDRISQFMQRIGAGGRVFVVLSDKYLRSGFCMYELFEIWRNSKWDDQDFLGRIRAYALPDATIFGIKQRLDYAIAWKQRFEEIDGLTRQHGADILGPRDFNEFRLMKQFYLHISEMLATIADVVLARTFEQLREYGLDDLVPQL
jgi:internalin A